AQVCYDRLGCFTNDRPWAGTLERPIAKLPWSPETINTRFALFTRQNPSQHQEISAISPSSISNSNFQLSRKTHFIVHGFIDKGEEGWLVDMCKVSLQRELARAAQPTVRDGSFKWKGQAGCQFELTVCVPGLDPAEPYFQYTPLEVRLDPSDAAFVDVIHTDAAPMIPNLGFGLMQPVGHMDFYPNGGKEMPGCDKNAISDIIDIDGIWEGTRNFVACNHLRPYKYYTESIQNNNGFMGYPCSSYESFQLGDCPACPSGGCPLMGHYANFYSRHNRTESQYFYLNTGDGKPFARKTKLQPLKTYTKGVDVEVNVGEITKVKFLWDSTQVISLFPMFGAETVTVERGLDGRVVTRFLPTLAHPSEEVGFFYAGPGNASGAIGCPLESIPGHVERREAPQYPPIPSSPTKQHHLTAFKDINRTAPPKLQLPYTTASVQTGMLVLWVMELLLASGFHWSILYKPLATQ
ncbi:LIPR2 protein, partial [Polypterus senegalus]